MKGYLKAENIIRGRLPKAESIKGHLHKLPYGVNTEDATAEATDIFAPKTAYVKGEKVEGVLVKATLETTVNGEFEPPENTLYDHVSVAIPDPPLADLEVTENGEYTPDEGVYGFRQVKVAIPDPPLVDLEITENGLYLPGEGVYGFGQVLVNVKTIPDDCIVVNARDDEGYWSDITIYGKIHPYQFQNETHLTRVTIADGVPEIPTYAFYGCSALVEVEIPDTITYIGSYAFYGCTSLEVADIHEGVTSIGACAFQGCTSLRIITVPESVATIDRHAFYNTTGAEVVYYNAIAAVNPSTSSNVEYNVIFQGCGAKTLVIGDNVTIIPQTCFQGATGLETVVMGASVDDIQHYAFRNCTSLKSIVIPESVTKIGRNAFSGTAAMETVYFNAIAAEHTLPASNPDAVAIFTGSGVKKVVFGDDAKAVPLACFCEATLLEEVDLANVEIIRQAAFWNCQALTSIEIPASVTTIETTAFRSCVSIASVKWNPVDIDSVGSSYNPIFQGCSAISSFVFADNVNKVPAFLLRECTGPMGDVVIPENVHSIGEGAFYGCTGLTSINVPYYVNEVGTSAFYNCTSLATVYWDAGAIGYVGSSYNPIFKGCTALKNFVIGDAVEDLPKYLLQECTGIESIAIPANVSYIGEHAFYKCTSLATVYWGASGVESVGTGIFAGCSGLKSFIIESSIVTLPPYLLQSCTGIESITIPGSVATIGNYAFTGCTALASVTIENGVTTIGNYVFQSCKALTEITIPESVTSIGRNIMDGCSALATVYFNAIDSENSTVNRILGSTTMTSIVIGDSVRVIPAGLCYGCSKIVSVVIPNSVEVIEDNAFESISALTSVQIGTSAECRIAIIGSTSFGSNSKLTSVTVHAPVDSVAGSPWGATKAAITWAA